jgi:hypothetical protein
VRFKVGIKDYCVYWFRLANDHLRRDQRAGLVATNSVSQNRARSASLEYVAGGGGVITDAVPTQVWPGTAKVHVSLVNWIKEPTEPVTQFTLNGVEVSGITPDLRTPDTSAGGAEKLPANKGRCFQGLTPVGEGFIVTAEEAQALLARTDGDYRDVVRPYLTGEDIADDPGQQPRRWIIDLGRRPLEQAMRYPAALKIVKERVKPVREYNKDRFRREHWWLFSRPIPPFVTPWLVSLGSSHRLLRGSVCFLSGRTLPCARATSRMCSPSMTTIPWGFSRPGPMGRGRGRGHRR